MKKILILFIFLTAFLFTFSNSVCASEKVNPGSGSYQIKRLKEKVILWLKFSPQAKIEYYKVLLGKRLDELVHVTNNKDIANIEKTSQRYETTAGQLTEYIMEKNLASHIESVLNIFDKHLKEIKKLKEIFTYDTVERRLVENDINSLNIYMNLLRK